MGLFARIKRFFKAEPEYKNVIHLHKDNEKFNNSVNATIKQNVQNAVKENKALYKELPRTVSTSSSSFRSSSSSSSSNSSSNSYVDTTSIISYSSYDSGSSYSSSDCSSSSSSSSSCDF